MFVKWELCPLEHHFQKSYFYLSSICHLRNGIQFFPHLGVDYKFCLKNRTIMNVLGHVGFPTHCTFLLGTEQCVSRELINVCSLCTTGFQSSCTKLFPHYQRGVNFVWQADGILVFSHLKHSTTSDGFEIIFITVLICLFLLINMVNHFSKFYTVSLMWSL